MRQFIPECYKNQKTCSNKTVDNYSHTLVFVPNCYKTRKICNKAINTVNTYPSPIQLVS